MQQYLELLNRVLNEGTYKDDRTGTGAFSVFGHQMRFDLSEGFPLVTTKKCHLKSIIHELLWFLQGDTNIKYLTDNGVTIWNEWADENGELGPVYGFQWRSWPDPHGNPIDQIHKAQQTIRTNPNSRRIMVSAWNPAMVDEMALPPCHALFQFYSREMAVHERLDCMTTEQRAAYFVRDPRQSETVKVMDELGIPTRKLSCQLYQRSADIFLGVPFNIASYALLTMMMAQVCGLEPGEFIWTGGDCHLYSNHIEQACTQVKREPKPLPKMRLNPAINDIFDFHYDDFELTDYEHHSVLRAPIAV